MWVVEPTEIQTDLLSERPSSNSANRIVPVRVLSFSSYKKVICKNSELGQCATVEAVISNEQPPGTAEISTNDQKEFRENVEKWVAGLAAPERNKAKKLLKKYACVFATNNEKQEEQAWLNMKLILAKRDQ